MGDPTRLLFRTELQPRLLGLILLNTPKEWTAADLARQLHAPPAAVHRELHRGLSAGVLTREPVGRTFLYRAAVDSPIYEPLRVLLERTVGVEPELRRALSGLPGVEAAFIHGSYARATSVRPVGDVDLVVVGTVEPHRLRRRVREVERKIGREIDILAYSRKELDDLVRRRNSLVHGIVTGPLIPVVGSADVLPEVA